MSTFTPRYAIGDKVWHAYTTRIAKVSPCPDCLGTCKWEAKSPAGDTFEMTCPRCARYHSNAIPDLHYYEYTGAARQLTIGSVQIDTARDDVYSYMCVETGVGTGSVYSERQLFDDEETAIVHGNVEAKIQNESNPQTVERIKALKQFSSARFANAEKKIAEDNERTVVLRGQYLAEELHALADEVSLTDNDLCDKLHTLGYKAENLRTDRVSLDKLIAENLSTTNAR